MTSLLEFFYDGRKIFMTIALTLLFIIVFFVYNIEMVPYSVFLLLFSKYFGDINPTAFLIFYFFLTAYIYSCMIIVAYDLLVIVAKGGKKNAS